MNNIINIISFLKDFKTLFKCALRRRGMGTRADRGRALVLGGKHLFCGHHFVSLPGRTRRWWRLVLVAGYF